MFYQGSFKSLISFSYRLSNSLTMSESKLLLIDFKLSISCFVDTAPGITVEISL